MGDDDLTQYLDEGQEAFARTTELFTDATTPSITRVTVTAGEPFVALSPKIHRILSGYLQTAQAEVMDANLNELDRLYWGTTTETTTATAAGASRLALRATSCWT